MTRLAPLALVLLALVPLAACGSDDGPDEVSASFDGTSCHYDGPAEFDVDTEVTFRVLNSTSVNDVGFSVWKVPEGTTVDEVAGHPEGIFGLEIPGDPIRGARFSGENPPGEEKELVVTLDTPGAWLLNCWNTSVVSAPATLFTVTDG